MRHARGLILLIVLAAATVAAAGDIQVLCEPGLRVYLDGELAGISSRLDDGAYLTDVPRGLHTVRVEKDGFVPQRFEVLVGQVPVEVTVGTFEPAPDVDPGHPAPSQIAAGDTRCGLARGAFSPPMPSPLFPGVR